MKGHCARRQARGSGLPAADTAPDATVRAQRVLAAGDRSEQVHAAHGAARQVEVLREVLVGLLQNDPTLQCPRWSRPTRAVRHQSS